MTDVNHRRKTKKPVNQRHPDYEYNNGYGTHGGRDKGLPRISDYSGDEIIIRGQNHETL